MRKHLLALGLCLLCLSGFAQTHLYENPDFDKIAANHKIISILPFETRVTLRPKQMKDITPEQLERMEQTEAEGLQAALYSWFLKRDKRGDLTVQVQDPHTTNATLIKAGVTKENFEQYTPADLAKILGVDAIIMGHFETNKPMSEGAAIALAVLGGFGSTNKAVVNLYIYNAEDGALLVNYNKGISGTLGSSTEDLVNILMRKASRRITYTK